MNNLIINCFSELYNKERDFFYDLKKFIRNNVSLNLRDFDDNIIISEFCDMLSNNFIEIGELC